MSDEAPERIWILWDNRGEMIVFDTYGNAPADIRDDVEYTRSDLLNTAEARAEAAEAERDRLRMILEARDAFDAGEPSKPPHTGKDRATLAKMEKPDE